MTEGLYSFRRNIYNKERSTSINIKNKYIRDNNNTNKNYKK